MAALCMQRFRVVKGHLHTEWEKRPTVGQQKNEQTRKLEGYTSEISILR